MGGVNPYIEKPPVKKPTKRFTVTFQLEETGETKVVEVDPCRFPSAEPVRRGVSSILLWGRVWMWTTLAGEFAPVPLAMFT